MGNLTRSGVCYEVCDSPFYQDWKGYRFYFSSEVHRRNFFNKACIREEWLSDSLSRRFHFKIDASLIAVFQLYHQIETRGFFVIDDEGHEFTCLSEISMVSGMK